jgi:hypothetical protein
MRFAVESWSNDYGAPIGLDTDTEVDGSVVDVEVEMPAAKWSAIMPTVPPAASLVFVDGVQQMDARIWVPDEDGVSRMGACVSFAAGSVRCDGSARVEAAVVSRAVFAGAGFGSIECGGGICYAGKAVVDTTVHGLDMQVQRHRDALEVHIAQAIGAAELIVIDGHLSRREGIAGAVGYIKTHQAQYLPQEVVGLVGRLAPGQRTPLFLIQGSGNGYARYSWYLKLPGGNGHPWAGVVRCEASSALTPVDSVVEFADRVSITLPRFASKQYKDPRAPQNLYPVAGLERELRRRMGDRELLWRALHRASNES